MEELVFLYIFTDDLDRPVTIQVDVAQLENLKLPTVFKDGLKHLLGENGAKIIDIVDLKLSQPRQDLADKVYGVFSKLRVVDDN